MKYEVANKEKKYKRKPMKVSSDPVLIIFGKGRWGKEYKRNKLKIN